MFLRLLACAALALQLAFFPVSGFSPALAADQSERAYDYAVLPLERNGYKLHFDCMKRGLFAEEEHSARPRADLFFA